MPFDVVLVSECVLPKLYPLDPLAAAIDQLTALANPAVGDGDGEGMGVGALPDRAGAGPLVLVAYEYRYYPKFDPKTKFAALMAEKGFSLKQVPDDAIPRQFRLDDVSVSISVRFGHTLMTMTSLHMGDLLTLARCDEANKYGAFVAFVNTRSYGSCDECAGRVRPCTGTINNVQSL